jgi:hypothetical protein
MPRNFDELLEDDLTFVLGGETFTMHYVRPEVLAAWEDDPKDEKAIDALKRLDERVKMFLSPDQHERYDAVRARDDKPVTMAQLNDLATWVIEVQSDRPTQQPSPSGRGRGKTARTSEAA